MNKLLFIALIFPNIALTQWTEIYEIDHVSCLKDLVFVTDSIGFVVAKDLILKTETAGNSWEADTSFKGSFEFVDFASTDSGVICCNPSEGGEILFTNNLGSSWLTNLNDEPEPLDRIDFIQNGKMYGLLGSTTGFPHVILGTDNFDFYQHDSYFGLGTPYDIQFTTEDTGFVCGYLMDEVYSSLYKSIDGGETWQTDEGKYGPVYEIEFPSSRIGYGIGIENHVWKSVDYGETWGLIDIEYPENSAFGFLEFVNDSVGFCVRVKTTFEPDYAVESTIVKTSDGGLSWIKTDFPVDHSNFSRIYCLNSDTCFVLTCDKIYKTTNGGGIDTSDLAVSIVIPNDILIYPNPTTGIVSIFGVNSYFEMPQLVNLFGEKIYYDILNSEGETITINLASLPSGIYYLLNSKNQSTKILKI
ncbi:MAG TPA: hypothetical protein PLJ00_16635 [Chitinophagales bacterium]|nr:hypothetical protein [Chitinophagales bacterium]